MTTWAQDDGLIDLTSSFKGFTAPINELYDDIHRRGWTVNKVHIKDGQYVAEGKNPHGEKLEAFGRTDSTAVANLLVKVMRREHMRSSAIKEKVGAWDHSFEGQLQEIAQAYQEAPVYDPKAAPAWMDLAQDMTRRAQTIRQQISVEYTDDPTPYTDANEMREDVQQKRKIEVSRSFAHHPVWNEQQMLDYRLVVDVLGHTVGGADWGWHGTCLAFASLAPMLAETPQKALFTELVGQTAFGSTYRQWGPQKIAFLDELIEKAQEGQNGPGHSGVHPSQSIVPGMIPRIGTTLKRTQDPNADWESGVSPLPDNAYLWQRVNGVDPLDAQGVTDSLREIEPGITKMHPELAKQAVVNAMRSSLLGSRRNDRSHAIHYQTLHGVPAAVDDPMAYWEAFEQGREGWNQTQGYAPHAHEQYWPEKQQFMRWIKALNPQLDDGAVQRMAKRELVHMLVDEEQRLAAQDPSEELTTEQLEHESYEAIRARLKSLTKPKVNQETDFGDQHLFHEAAADDGTMQWQPGQWGKGAIIDGQLHTWSTGNDRFSQSLDNGIMGEPHHLTYLRDLGIDRTQRSEDAGRASDHIVINPEGYYFLNGEGTDDVTRFAVADRALRYDPKSKHMFRNSTYHADMYPPYMYSHLRPLAQISRNATALSDAAREDLVNHHGHGHHFRATALSLGIPEVGARQASHAWMHLAPQTSQLGIIDPQMMELLGHGYEDMSPRDYFKFERELAAGRDAAGYGHVPLGAFSAGLHDLKTGGPGWHPDRTALKAVSPTPHTSIDWTSTAPTYPDWPEPYWWNSTQQARDAAGQDFDRQVAVDHSRSEVPFQRSSAWPPGGTHFCPTCNQAMVPNGWRGWTGVNPSGNPVADRSWSCPSCDTSLREPQNRPIPWVTHPVSGERVSGPPGTSLMQHLKDTMGHQSPQEVWNQDYEVGKGEPPQSP